MHPDTLKLAEFRDKNIALLKEIEEVKARYDGLDPDVARAALANHEALTAKLASFDGIDPEEYRTLKARPDTTTLEAELAAERVAHSATLFRSKVSEEFLRAGGRESAIDFMVTEAKKTFAVEKGEVSTTEFSPTKPGQRLTLSEWMGQQIGVADFAFKPSKGGGAPVVGSGTHRLGARPNSSELRDPSPQQLGQHASDIASGKLKVVYTT